MTAQPADRSAAAVAAINGHRPDLAEKLIRAQLAETPANGDAHRILGVALRAQRKLKDALAEGDESVRLAPRAPLCHLDRGRTLHALKRLPDAETAIRRCLELSPRETSALSSLSSVLADRGELENAEQAARDGLAIDPRSTECLRRLAFALLLTHRVDEAHEVLTTALLESPSQAILHHELGLALLHRGFYEEAATEFRETLRLSPQMRSAAANLRLAESYRDRAANAAPYGLRFAFVWSRQRQAPRLLGLAALAALGFLWPLFWGMLLMALARELQTRMARTSISQEMRRPIIGVAWTAVLIAAIVIISAQTRSGGGGVAAAAGEDRFSAGLEQVFAGAALWFVLLPAAVTTGRARSTAAGFAVLGLGVVAVASIYGGASFGGLALLVMGALALFTPRIVLAAERRESDPDEVEV